MNAKSLLLAALVTGFALPAFADDKTKPDPKTDDKTPVVVPFELLDSGHFVVKAKFGDKGPYRFILDTGAPLTIVNSKTAKEAKLTVKAAGGGGLLGMLGGGLNQVSAPKVSIGDVTVEKMPLVVMDHPTVSAISDYFKKESGPIEGLIGFPFFAKFAMTVDYQKKQLTFVPNGYKPGDYLQDMMNSLMKADERNAPRVVASAGLWGFAVDKDKADEDAGVKVTTVLADGPAAKAGFRSGDRLLTLDGRWTDTPGDAAVAASLVKPGRTATAVVKRDGKDVKLTVTPVVGN